MSNNTAAAAQPAFVELHCHSAFSLLDGGSLPEALVERAHSLGYPALALTDHDELGGVVRFAQAAATVGLGGILGAELTVDVEDPTSDAPRRTHLVLLAQTREGYGNISQLITRARMDQPRGQPSVTFEQLAQRTAGIFALTGCPRGWVPQLAREGRARDARRALGQLTELFPDRLAVEVWDHGLPEERRLVRRLLPIAHALGVPWVVTNNVHYAKPDGRIVHDVLTALRHERALDDMGTRLRPNGEWYLKSAAQLATTWQGHEAGLTQSLAIAEQCAFRLEQLRPSLRHFRCHQASQPTPTSRNSSNREPLSGGAHRAPSAAPPSTTPSWRMNSPSSPSSNWPGSSSLCGTLCALRDAKAFSARGAVRPPTAPSATAWGSPRWTPCAWSCCSNGS